MRGRPSKPARSSGFLPGDLQEKVNPYLRPLYDALYDMLDAERVERLLERGVIEVAPIAFMRGRTLNDAFVILDEAQNTTSEQMKMFLTRLGFGSKAVVTGDVTQIDLPAGRMSGLVEALRVVKDIEGVATILFDERDVVRHQLVQQIVKAYERTGASSTQPAAVTGRGRPCASPSPTPGAARSTSRVWGGGWRGAAPAGARGRVAIALVSGSHACGGSIASICERDYATDVLSFPATGPASGTPLVRVEA